MSDSIRRLEDAGDTVRVITKDWMDLADFRSANVLTREHESLFVHPVSKDTVRVGTAAHVGDTDGYQIHGANGIYFETPLVERELTDSEIEWCEDTFIHAGSSQPETVVEFEIPQPEALKAAIKDQALDRFPNLDAVVQDAEHRHRVLTKLQEDLEVEKFRATKLPPRKGHPKDMDPEWHPEDSHNDDRDRKHLYDMASMRKDAHWKDFRTIAGIDYTVFFMARTRILGVHEPHLDEYSDLIGLGIVGADDWSYCRECGGVLPEEEFLHVQRRGYDQGRTLRVCTDCAENDYANRFTEQGVAEAKDERAQRLGGQRRIETEYETDSTD